MAQTFQAVLTGDQLKWNPSRPAQLPRDQPILVNVTVSDATVLDDPVSLTGSAMSAALEQLARLAPFAAGWHALSPRRAWKSWVGSSSHGFRRGS